MSAFICNNSHVTALAAYAARERLAGNRADLESIGQLLHVENCRSVDYRYRETNEPDFTPCKWAASHSFSPAQIVKAARCLAYQSCEHPGWELSEAHAIVEAIIGRATSDVTGYNEAAWEIQPPTVDDNVIAALDRFADVLDPPTLHPTDDGVTVDQVLEMMADGRLDKLMAEADAILDEEEPTS